MTWLAVGVAWACMCDTKGVIDAWPRDGDEGVPAATVVFVRDDSDDTYALVDDAGEPVAVAVDARDELSFGTAVLVPETELGVGRAYTVLGGEPTWSFTTGEGEVVPVAGAGVVEVLEVEAEAEGGSSCPADNHVDVALSLDDGAEPAWWEVEITRDGEASIVRMVHDRPTIGTQYTCFTNAELEPGDVLSLRARGVAADAVPGPWGEAVQIDLPGGCGCGTAAPPGFGILGFAIAFTWRRRCPYARRTPDWGRCSP